MSSTDTRVSVIMGVQEDAADRWNQFVAIYRPMLSSYFRKQGLSEADVQDVLQDVFMKLVKKIGTYDRRLTKFRTWLFAVARHALIDHARRRAVQKKALEEWVKRTLSESPDDQRSMEEEFESIHRDKILDYAVGKVRRAVSPEQWACFEQRLMKNRSGAEVAEELGITTNAVFVNTCRVLKKIRKVCQAYDEDVPGPERESA